MLCLQLLLMAIAIRVICVLNREDDGASWPAPLRLSPSPLLPFPASCFCRLPPCCLSFHT